MASRFRAAGLLAGLLLTTAPKLCAGEIEVRQISNFVLELSGGRGPAAWHIQYGTPFRAAEFKTLAGPDSTAYFSQRNWLRRIDTDKGVVTGRWMFPEQVISDLQWANGHLRVEVATGGTNALIKRTYDFDPLNPQPPPSNQVYYSEGSRAEGLRSIARPQFTKEAAENLVPELENASRRDPFAPWLRIVLGHLYTILGRSEGSQTIHDGIRMESAHFSELLDIANYLDGVGEREAARLAFERGYAEFWRLGQDPRLVSSLLVSGSNLIRPNTPPALQRELANRVYATSPWVDGAAKAWELYGKFLLANGEGKEGALWLGRAKDARSNGLFVSGDERYYEALAASLVTTTFLAAALLYILVLYSRYRPQRRARLAAERAARVSRPGFCNVEYWRRGERLAFLSIVAIAWIAEGVAGTALKASSSRSLGSFYEMQAGSLFSSNAMESLESRVTKNPERDLLLAIAYQRDGQAERATTVYKSLPQFAESWNNLGVLLKNSGKAEESRRAFERALQLRADFPEAEWNLGKPARGEWVKLHEHYVPDKPMMTVPTREQVLKAYDIKRSSAEWTTILKGPLEPDEEVNSFFRPRGRLRAGLLIFLAAGALIVVFLRPREVLLPPPRYQVFLELLFPGTARLWGALGGISLGAACFFSSAVWPPVWSRYYSYVNYYGILRRFPLPFSLTRGGVGESLSPIPSVWWLVALLTINTAVVLFWKWRRK